MPGSLVLIEGVSGSGKTTASMALVARYRQAGLQVGWALEEDPEHPFFGAQIRRSHRSADFRDTCLRSWQEIVAACSEHPWVLEGVAFQSTVRFMFEQCMPEDSIHDYWARFAAIVRDVDARLVLLRPPDVASFIREHTAIVRTDVWDKMAAYVRSTPVAKTLDSTSDDIPVEFWVRYAELCDRLVDGSKIPLLTVDVSRGWAGVNEMIAQHAGFS